MTENQKNGGDMLPEGHQRNETSEKNTNAGGDDSVIKTREKLIKQLSDKLAGTTNEVISNNHIRGMIRTLEEHIAIIQNPADAASTSNHDKKLSTTNAANRNNHERGAENRRGRRGGTPHDHGERRMIPYHHSGRDECRGGRHGCKRGSGGQAGERGGDRRERRWWKNDNKCDNRQHTPNNPPSGIFSFSRYKNKYHIIFS